MKLSIVIFFLIFSNQLFCQVVFDKTEHDFGEINLSDNRFIDIYLKNTGDKEAYLLSVKKPDEIAYIHKGSLILPNESTIIRLQVNPKRVGKFKYEIPVYTSDRDKPVIIKLKGDLLEIVRDQRANFTQCPSFSQKPGDGNPLDFQLTVKTVDAESKESISSSTVTVLQNGRPIGKWSTGKNGDFKTQIPIGISYFYATHPNYKPAELGAYVNFKRSEVIIELEKDQTKELVNMEEDLIESKEDVTTLKERLQLLLEEELITKKIEKDTVVKELSDEVVEGSPKFEKLDNDNFDESLFKPVNVVFVIDVSSSMNQADRMELMKYSLYELVDMLRPQDKLGLVSYASNANVLLEPTSGENKDEINKLVEGLKASGLTAGGEGIKLGFKQARRNLIDDGANQVIIITDGAFNKNSGNYKKVIERNLKRKGITLSVVGIKNNEKSATSMREAVDIGGGNFIEVHKLVDAQNNLKQAIRKSAFRY